MTSNQVAAASVVLLLSLSPAAFAQTPEGPTPGTAPVAAAGEDVEVLVEIDRPPNMDERDGPARRELAIMQTTLLNRFSELGFSDVEEFRREGETYVAEAVDADGQEVTVVIDPIAGTVIARR